MAREVKTIVDGLSYAESPRWHEGRLWFVDFYTNQVLSVCEDGSDLRLEFEVPQQPSGLGWLPDGRLLVVSMRDAKILRREPSGALTTHADLSGYVSSLLNDMVVDASGRAYVGNFGFDLMHDAPIETTSLFLIQPDGTVSIQARDMWFPNGSIITPDGKTLIVAESFGHRISAFDIDAQDGTLGPRRDWASFGELPQSMELDKANISVVADGCCLDAEGCVWFADTVGHRVVRIREGGDVVEEVAIGSGVFACMLGGSDGRTLFAVVAPDYREDKRMNVREASVVAIRVDVPHAGLP